MFEGHEIGKHSDAPDHGRSPVELGRFLLRATIGSFFVGHGTQKLFGWFGGDGPKATSENFESAGLRPGRAHAVLADAEETSGGALLAAGVATPAAAGALSAVMLTAIRTVHSSKGPWVRNGGYEYPVVMLAALFELAGAGPGRLSLDAPFRRERRGTRWAFAELAAAASVLSWPSRRAGGGPCDRAGTPTESPRPSRCAV
jgi:putative oxidoreductase